MFTKHTHSVSPESLKLAKKIDLSQKNQRGKKF